MSGPPERRSPGANPGSDLLGGDPVHHYSKTPPIARAGAAEPVASGAAISGRIISMDELRQRRRLRIEREAFEAKREATRREASDRLRRLLDGEGWPPPGGHAA